VNNILKVITSKAFPCAKMIMKETSKLSMKAISENIKREVTKELRLKKAFV